MAPFDNLRSALTSYGLAFMGMISTDNLAVNLGLLLLVVRLLYETLRLWRAITKGNISDD